MDIVGGVHLADGVELKCVSGIDDNSRYVVSAKLVARATARPVCEALLEALGRHGVPEQILTDNGKVFTGRFGPRGSASEVLFDRICAENGIRHLLTAPRSPTTTGKVERLHKTMRAECFRIHDRRHATIGELQAAVDAWVVEYNTRRPHQSLGMRPPAERMTWSRHPNRSPPCPRPGSARPEPAAARWSPARGVVTGQVGDDGSSGRPARSGWPGLSTGCRWCWPGNACSAWSRRTWCRSSTAGCWSAPARNATLVAARASGRCRSWSATAHGQGWAAAAARRRCRSHQDGGLRRVDLVRRHLLPGRHPLGRPAGHRCGDRQPRADQLRTAPDQGPSHPARPGQGTRRLRPPARTPGTDREEGPSRRLSPRTRCQGPTEQ